MTIDEAIAKYKDITNTDAKCPIHCMRSCDKCVQESEQIAEWLEELKAYQRDSVLRPAFEKMKVKSYQKGYRQGYSKAIDDLVIIAMKQFTDFDLKNRYQSGSDYKVILRNVADQLKKGGNSGWIPCSDRLPEEAFGCLVTVIDCNPVTQKEFENILPYVVGYDGNGWNDIDGETIPFEVIAWMELPSAYRPKEK